MRKYILIVALFALGLGVACMDAVAPTAVNRLVSGPSALSLLGTGPSTTQFTISPSGTSVNLFGVFALNFPANSVCDPNASGCTPITSPITVTATVQVTNGRVWADFSPHLNFVDNPSDRSTWVTIATNLYAPYVTANRGSLSSNRVSLRKYALLFANSIGGNLIDEGGQTGNGTLKTRVSLKTGTIWRRITHFTGYSILTGDACDPSPDDPYCVEVKDDPDPDDCVQNDNCS